MLLPKALEKIIAELETLPGIGPRSATRLAYFLLRAPDQVAFSLAQSLKDIKQQIKTCKRCYNYSEDEICLICRSSERDQTQLMIVEDPLDVVAFERIGKYKGVYHVLGGVMSPLNGIGPEEIRIKELLTRINQEKFNEIIIATNPNLEGESTALYLKKEIEKSHPDMKIT
jgi:recombination protein RecR